MACQIPCTIHVSTVLLESFRRAPTLPLAQYAVQGGILRMLACKRAHCVPRANIHGLAAQVVHPASRGNTPVQARGTAQSVRLVLLWTEREPKFVRYAVTAVIRFHIGCFAKSAARCRALRMKHRHLPAIALVSVDAAPMAQTTGSPAVRIPVDPAHLVPSTTSQSSPRASSARPEHFQIHPEPLPANYVRWTHGRTSRARPPAEPVLPGTGIVLVLGALSTLHAPSRQEVQWSQRAVFIASMCA